MDGAVYAEDEAGLRTGVSKATDAIEVLRCLFISEVAEEVSADDVAVVLTLALRWHHFENHEEYRELRLRERKLLEDMLTHCNYDAFAVHRVLLDRIESPLSAHAEVPRTKDWLVTLRETNNIKVAQEFVAALKRPDGIVQITHRVTWDSYLIDEPASPSLTAQLLEQLQQLSASAKVDRVIHNNLLQLFLALASALRRRGNRSGQTFTGLFCQPAIVDAVWAGAVAARLNPRFVGTLRDERVVVNAAVPAAALLTPPWWEASIAELKG